MALGETVRLLAANLYLFTLISLTVWLPGHILRNYAMSEGMAAWWRLFLVRLIVNCAVAVPALGGLGIQPSGPSGIAAASLLVALAVLVFVLLVRYAVVDSVVVLEGGNAVTAWRRAARLTAGRRWPILGTAAVLFVVILSCAMLLGQAFKAAPELNHFVVRVLVDCVLAVGQSSFTVAFFLLYWRARAAVSPVPAPA